MKINKFIKHTNNKYKVIIDDNEYILYDDIIIKYNLLSKKEINNKDLNKILIDNDELSSYYMAIKYISLKLRSTKEIKEYLKKKNINEEVINKTIKKLIDNNFLNDEIYLKAYINDKINLSNDGPKKICRDLINLGIDEVLVNERINNISSDIWDNKIDNYISKKIKMNHKDSASSLKTKLLSSLINLGYDKENILSILNNYDIIDKDIYIKEREKAIKKLSSKYEGDKLNYKVKEYLYRKGFKERDYYEE